MFHVKHGATIYEVECPELEIALLEQGNALIRIEKKLDEIQEEMELKPKVVFTVGPVREQR